MTLDLQSHADKLEGFGGALAAVEGACGVTFARMSQVHGDAVVDVAEAWPAGPRPVEEVPEGDALVTTAPGVGLMVRVADCVPVLLADPAHGVVAAVHAGRKGVALDIVGSTVDRMVALGAAQLRAWVGPHICGRCYEVPADMRDEIASVLPEAHAQTSWGTPALDLGAGVAQQLVKRDVAVTRVEGCTLEDARFHSYRRDGQAAGRFAGLVWVA